MATNSDRLKCYGGRIETFLDIEGCSHMWEELEEIGEKLDAIDLKLSEKTLKLDVKFALQKEVDFDLDCDEALDIESRINCALSVYTNSLQANMIDYRLESSHMAEAHMIRIEFEITSTQLSFKEYTNRNSKESLDLWKEIKKSISSEEFQKKFPFAMKITRGRWKLGSLIIHVVLLKDNGENWTKSEHGIIDLFLPSLSDSVVAFLPLVECRCRRLDPQIDDPIGWGPADSTKLMKVTVTFDILNSNLNEFHELYFFFPNFLTSFWELSFKDGAQIEGRKKSLFR